MIHLKHTMNASTSFRTLFLKLVLGCSVILSGCSTPLISGPRIPSYTGPRRPANEVATISAGGADDITHIDGRPLIETKTELVPTWELLPGKHTLQVAYGSSNATVVRSTYSMKLDFVAQAGHRYRVIYRFAGQTQQLVFTGEYFAQVWDITANQAVTPFYGKAR
ncbi:MAG TPA: hypothetical protein VGO11_10165 [Chthoniobacteraceae bacterium]|jgi:hypothetical protein|nr:hypothetical protein [Chthoniobacteraceae bacterium]